MMRQTWFVKLKNKTKANFMLSKLQPCDAGRQTPSPSLADMWSPDWNC